MNNSPVKSELYVALEMVELTQFLPFTKFELKTFTYLETSVKWMYVVSLFTEVFLYFSKLNPLNNIYE